MLTPLAIVLAILGAAWGFVADRIAQRWPEHVHEHVHSHEVESVGEGGDGGAGAGASAGASPDAGPDPEHEHAHAPGDEPEPGRAWAHEHPHEHRADLEHGWVVPRAVGWRTAVAVVVGAVALGGMAVRFADPVELALLVAYGAALVLLLAVDLDQRLLPNLLTLPMALVAGIAGIVGAGPFVSLANLPIAVVAAVALPWALYAFSIPFARGAFGRGDVMLLLSVGLLLGAIRLVYAVVVGVLLAGIVLVALLAGRRITLKSFVPYGPFLVLGTLWAILVIR